MRHVLCDSVLSYERNRWKFEHVIRNSMGNEIWSIYNDKYFEILSCMYVCFDMDNSDGKASLKQQKSPETTTDTQGMSKFYWFYV